MIDIFIDFRAVFPSLLKIELNEVPRFFSMSLANKNRSRASSHDAIIKFGIICIVNEWRHLNWPNTSEEILVEYNSASGVFKISSIEASIKS